MSYQEILTGAVKSVEVRYRESCSFCSGKQEASLEDLEEKCPNCHGKGYVEQKRWVQVRIPARTYEKCFYFLDDVLCEGEKEIPQNLNARQKAALQAFWDTMKEEEEKIP